MKRGALVMVVLVGGAMLWFFVAVIAVRLWPSGLSVRFDPAVPWQSVSIIRQEDRNSREPRRFSPSGEPVYFHPIKHGYHDISIQLADGRTVWTTFLHLDAGERRRMDLFVSPSARRGNVHLRLTANEWLRPRRLMLFDGDVLTESTSASKPVSLVDP